MIEVNYCGPVSFDEYGNIRLHNGEGQTKQMRVLVGEVFIPTKGLELSVDPIILPAGVRLRPADSPESLRSPDTEHS